MADPRSKLVQDPRTRPPQILPGRERHLRIPRSPHFSSPGVHLLRLIRASGWIITPGLFWEISSLYPPNLTVSALESFMSWAGLTSHSPASCLKHEHPRASGPPSGVGQPRPGGAEGLREESKDSAVST